MVCDRLVVGIWDAGLSQQLQLDSELTLEKAKMKIRQKEAVGEQQKELKASAEGTTSLEELRFRRTAPAQEPRELGPTKSHAYKCHTYYEGVYSLWKRATLPRKISHERRKLPSMQ